MGRWLVSDKRINAAVLREVLARIASAEAQGRELNTWLRDNDMEGLECSQTVELENVLASLRQDRALISDHAGALLDRIAELEAEAAESDEVIASTLAKWEEMERCAYNICAHCKEPFERGDAMSLHAQECPRNPVVMLNVAQAERITVLEAGLREALAGWARETRDPYGTYEPGFEVRGRLRALLLYPKAPEAPRAGEAGK